ncbi:MAG: transposase [Candidatus Pacebacteria bacterium]|nr:transposase [Candidatus Paceibacterota bacterium]
MEEFNETESHPFYASRASLSAIAAKQREMKLFDPIHQRVKIAQKKILYSPTDKLYQAYVGLLSGICGIVEINERLRADPVLQRSFGMEGCADQSVIQETLSACTEANASEIEEAIDLIYQAHGRGFRHDYSEAFQILDIDLTGQPCGRKAEFATKGYFAKQRNRRGRQLGRVLATRYQEIVADRLYPGRVQLNSALPDLLAAAESALKLDAEKRRRTILRIDAGGGTREDINRALTLGYQIHGKDYSSVRAEKLAESVVEWVSDPRDSNRQFGRVTTPATEYVRPVVRIAVRCRSEKDGWKAGAIVSTLSEAEAIREAGLSEEESRHPQSGLLAYVRFYDRRGGACETEFKGDKQGLGMTKRNKKRFAAQRVLTALGALAHNALIWAKAWLLEKAPVLSDYGIMRIRRDLLAIQGVVEFDSQGSIRRISLNPYSLLARHCFSAFQSLLAPLSIVVILGQT